ncbi:MAG: hypothetical protein U5R49_19310 [Deltaproteobacteria bacterium]|nr:hypothetical protein [Deltaproteobacteria bacterium]
MVIVASAVLVKSLLLFLVLTVFSQQVVVSTSYLRLSGISIVINSLLAPLLFKLLNRLRSVLEREDDSGSTESL